VIRYKLLSFVLTGIEATMLLKGFILELLEHVLINCRIKHTKQSISCKKQLGDFQLWKGN
jgi:hypothetical protein